MNISMATNKAVTETTKKKEKDSEATESHNNKIYSNIPS